MAGELTHWLSGDSVIDRQYGREMEAVEHTADIAEVKVAGVNRVTHGRCTRPC